MHCVSPSGLFHAVTLRYIMPVVSSAAAEKSPQPPRKQAVVLLFQNRIRRASQPINQHFRTFFKAGSKISSNTNANNLVLSSVSLFVCFPQQSCSVSLNTLKNHLVLDCEKKVQTCQNLCWASFHQLVFCVSRGAEWLKLLMLAAAP